MKQQKQSQLVIGIGVVILLGIIAAIILLLGFGEGLFASTYKVTALFKHAGGIKKDTPVYMAGVVIGYVDKLIPPSVRELNVQIIMNIYKDKDIMADAKLYIESLGLIGEKYLEFTVGQEKAIIPKDGNARIIGEGAGGLQKVGQTIAETAEEFKTMLKNVSGFIASKRFKYSVSKSFKAFAKFNSKGSILFKELQAKIKELEIKNINNATSEMTHSLKKVQDTLDSFNQLVNESKKIVGDLKSVQDIVNNTKAITEKTNAILTKISEGQGTLGELVNNKELYFTIKNALNRFDTTLSSLSEKLYSSIDAFTDNLQEIKGLVKDIRSGKGTAGKFISDEAAYNKILNTLEDIKNTFNSIKKTSDDAGKFVADLKDCPDAIAWGWKTCKKNQKEENKTLIDKRHRD